MAKRRSTRSKGSGEKSKQLTKDDLGPGMVEARSMQVQSGMMMHPVEKKAIAVVRLLLHLTPEGVPNPLGMVITLTAGQVETLAEQLQSAMEQVDEQMTEQGLEAVSVPPVGMEERDPKETVN